MNWSEFFAMGGYAFYVWTSWGLTVVVLVWLYLQPKITHRKLKRDIRRQIMRKQRMQSTE